MSDSSYSTRDLYLASFLLASGFELIDVQREPGGRRCRFFFRDGIGLREAADAFWSGAAVGARKFAAATRELKGRVWSLVETG